MLLTGFTLKVAVWTNLLKNMRNPTSLWSSEELLIIGKPTINGLYMCVYVNYGISRLTPWIYLYDTLNESPYGNGRLFDRAKKERIQLRIMLYTI